eukprot:234962-Rhodomonas_salina.1
MYIRRRLEGDSSTAGTQVPGSRYPGTRSPGTRVPSVPGISYPVQGWQLEPAAGIPKFLGIPKA